MSAIRKVSLKDLGGHILVEDTLNNFYMFEKVGEWTLNPKKMNDYFIPMEVYQTLWVKGYSVA